MVEYMLWGKGQPKAYMARELTHRSMWLLNQIKHLVKHINSPAEQKRKQSTMRRGPKPTVKASRITITLTNHLIQRDS